MPMKSGVDRGRHLRDIEPAGEKPVYRVGGAPRIGQRIVVLDRQQLRARTRSPHRFHSG